MRNAAATLTEAAEASDDPTLTLEILHLAAEAAADIGETTKVVRFGARAHKLAAHRRRDQFCKLCRRIRDALRWRVCAARATFDER